MNRRARKLKYIRKKNRIRRGEKLQCYITMTKQYHDDEFMDFLRESIAKQQVRYSNYYKTPLKFNYDVFVGQSSEDYMRGLLTARYTFQKI